MLTHLHRDCFFFDGLAGSIKIDEVRAQTRAIMSDAAWGQRSAYHITINTTGWDIKALVPAVADFAGRWFERKK